MFYKFNKYVDLSVVKLVLKEMKVDRLSQLKHDKIRLATHLHNYAKMKIGELRTFITNRETVR